MSLFRLVALALVFSSMPVFSDETEDLAMQKLFFGSKSKPPVKELPSTCPPVPEEPECCPKICRNDQRLQIGGSYTYAWVTPTGNRTSSGSLGGAQMLYEYRPEDAIYAAIAFNWRQGDTESAVSKRNLLDFDSQERLGYTLVKRNGHYRLSTYLGLGGRYMGEKVTVSNATVNFNYMHLYVPVGFIYDYEITSWFNWGLGFQWRAQIFPVVQMQPLDGAWWILKKHLDNFVVNMPLIFHVMADNFLLSIDPFFEFWHDGHSQAETLTNLALDLPGNQYYFVGVNINLGWEF